MGQKAFGHFALFKVARRKAGTLSGRCRSNGYVQKIKASHHASPEGEGTDWGMLKILAVLFAARQRGVEDGAAPPTRAGGDSYAFKLFKKLFLVLDEPSKRPL